MQDITISYTYEMHNHNLYKIEGLTYPSPWKIQLGYTYLLCEEDHFTE